MRPHEPRSEIRSRRGGFLQIAEEVATLGNEDRRSSKCGSPFEPTAFPSAGRTHLIYELHLRNFEAAPFALGRVEVLDADINGAPSVATFGGEQLDAILQPIGAILPAALVVPSPGGGAGVTEATERPGATP